MKYFLNQKRFIDIFDDDGTSTGTYYDLRIKTKVIRKKVSSSYTNIEEYLMHYKYVTSGSNDYIVELQEEDAMMMML